MKTKLVFVVSSLRGGGAERVVSTLCNCLSKGTFQVTIICLIKTEHAYRISENVKVVQLVERKFDTKIFFRCLYAILTLTRLILTLIKENPKCAISFMTTANLWTGLTCWLVNVPYFVSERITPDYTIHQFNRFVKWFSYQVYRKSKAIVIPAKGIEDCFKKYKAFEKVTNFQTIHNPVGRLGPGSQTPIYDRQFILGVGRLDPQKGFDLLIDAYFKLQPVHLDLLISGDGPERTALQDKIRRYGLESRIKLIGFKNNISSYYQQAEMFVLSSRNEGYPNALVEAMSFGCPVVAANCEFGPSEIVINEKNGLLVRPESSSALLKGIERLINDPILKYRISQNAIMINETNSLDAISKKWTNLILSHV
ncbi:glycosyltransferase [Desertivirga arenae]|uniref:glycosyltransferase n=1 Tax=Desertivirga arenae TaxID=2810309 RepID=UPI001A9710AD|nr:glycosyltransferase [Pedobacter sp. SYSU D00823]